MEWLNELASWAWARHHNELSWYIRPLFLPPSARTLLGERTLPKIAMGLLTPLMFGGLAAALGGRLTVQSPHGKGTVVRAEFSDSRR